MIISSNSRSRGSGMPYQVPDALRHAMSVYRAVPRTNRTPAPSSRAYQPKTARVERSRHCYAIKSAAASDRTGAALWRFRVKRVIPSGSDFHLFHPQTHVRKMGSVPLTDYRQSHRTYEGSRVRISNNVGSVKHFLSRL